MRTPTNLPNLVGATLLLALILVGGRVPAHADGSEKAFSQPDIQPQKPRTITILNLVDLMSGNPDPGTGSILRAALSKDVRWKVNPGATQDRSLRDNGIDPDSGCTEFQCGFDAGNALQTEFVLLGTIAMLRENYAYTLSLVHVPTSQIVWARSGDLLRSKEHRSGAALQEGLEFAVSTLDPAGLSLRRPPTLGLMAVMDAGRPSAYSRIALERALSRAYASRAYDLLGPEELSDLMNALDVRDGSDGSGGEDMLTLGTKMGVRYLLWTKVDADPGRYKLDVSLYDVAGRKLIRHWPSRETGNFDDLLGIEDRFLTALAGDQSQAAFPGQAAPGPGPSHWKAFGKYASVALAVAAAAGLGYLAYQSKQNADADYATYHQARSEQNATSARQRVIEEDVQARHYGMLGGFSFALGVAIWAL